MMDEEQAVTENQLEEPEKKEDLQSSKRFIVNNPPMYEQRSEEQKSGKKLLIIIVILILLVAGGYFAVRRIIQPAPVTTPAPLPISSPTPSPTSQPVLNRSDWSLEILNGSAITGAAKKIADKIQTLGYPVTKVGNAEGGASGTKETYSQTQIFVKKSLQDQVKLIIADLKDIIKIASVAGELKDSTASVRIIIGKDVVK